MNILHLKYAVEVAKAGSINKAAETLLMGQPNLSRAIKELEASLGIVIFDRSAKGMDPTPEGQEFLGYARQILKQIDQVEEIYKDGHTSKRKFSVSVPRACYISDAFSRFSSKIGESPVELFYKETNALRAVKNILEADYKLGIIRYAQSFDSHFKKMLEEKGLVYETVTHFNYSLIMRKDSPLAQKKDITFADLTPFIEIAHADPYVPNLSLAEVKKEELPDNIDRRIFVFERASQFELLSSNNQTFMWVSPVPQSLLDRYGLVQRYCEENKKIYKDVLIYHKGYQLSELDKMFIEEILKAKKEYIKKECN